MNKLILAMAVFAAVGFSSCEKCLTCQYGGGIPVEEEFCSKDADERDAFETSCELLFGTIK